MVGRGIRGQRRCATLWVGFHKLASLVRRERAVAARSSLALQQSSTREMPVRRKGEGPDLFYPVITGKQSTTTRKRIKGEISLVSRVSRNLITSSYLDPGSLPTFSSTRPTAFTAWYTCSRSSGGAAVVTGRSVEVAVGVASNVVRAPLGWSWAAPFVHGTYGRTRSSSVVTPRAHSVMADACRRPGQY